MYNVMYLLNEHQSYFKFKTNAHFCLYLHVYMHVYMYQYYMYHNVPGKRPLPGKCPCTTFQGATVAHSIETYGILIPGKRPCGPKSRVKFKRPWALTQDTKYGTCSTVLYKQTNKELSAHMRFLCPYFGSLCPSATAEASEMISSLFSLSLTKREANTFISSTIPACTGIDN